MNVKPIENSLPETTKTHNLELCTQITDVCFTNFCQLFKCVIRKKRGS